MKKNMPIRIAQIMGKWFGGGVEAVVMNYYRNIDRNKIQFDFICDSDSTAIPYEEIEKLGGSVILVPPYQKIFKYHKELKKVLRAGNYKIVHSHINTLSVFSLWAAKSVGIPIRIAHSHSTTNKEEWKKNLLKQLLRPFSKIFATDYMACSKYAGRWMFGNKAYNEGKVFLLNNAIDLNKFKYDEIMRYQKRKELGISDDTLVVGHIGRFVGAKNHQYLIDIFNELHQKNKKSILLLAGIGPLMDVVKAKVRLLGLEEAVKFLYQVDDTNALYHAFDVFVLPSLYEGLPVVGIEAQASSNVCFFSDNITREVKILDSTDFISLNCSPKEWAEIILASVEGHKKCDIVNEFLQSSFNIKSEVNKLEYKYLKLIGITDSKTKVLHLLSTSCFSGAENVACQIIDMYKNDINYEMVYCSVIGENRQCLDDRKIPVLELKKFSIKNIINARKKFKPNVVHAHDIKASIAAALLFRKTLVISHVHANHENMRKHNIKTFLFNLVSSRFTSIIWVSQSAFDNYVYKAKVKDKSIVLYNVIKVQELIDKIKEDKKEYPNYDLIFLGRLTYQKDPIRLIHIIKMLKYKKSDIKVAIVGTGDLENNIKVEIERNKLNNNVDFIGFVSNPYKILNSSKLLILTSRYEGTPMVALEAIALGIPIISTPTDGMKKLIKNNINGYLSEKNDILVEKILEILNDDTKLYQMIKNAKNMSKKLNNCLEYKKELSIIYEKR